MPSTIAELERFCLRRASDSGALRSDEEFPQKTWEAWIKNYFDEWGRLLTRRVYHDVPKIGEGKRGVNYGETRFNTIPWGDKSAQAAPSPEWCMMPEP